MIRLLPYSQIVRKATSSVSGRSSPRRWPTTAGTARLVLTRNITNTTGSSNRVGGTLSNVNTSHRTMSAVPLDEEHHNIDGIHHASLSSPAVGGGTVESNKHRQVLRTKNPVPDFQDSKIAYECQSTGELVRAAVCFRLCKIPILVNHAEMMLKLSRKTLGGTFTDTILKLTLFGHFCAGEDEQRIQPVLAKLSKAGVSSILDYAAESDGDDETPSSSPKHASPSFSVVSNEHGDADSGSSIEALLRQRQHPSTATTSREYDYESEAQCDKHVEIFKACINDVAKLNNNGNGDRKNDDNSSSNAGYAAIKVTALGNPKLLARMSQAITEAKRLFEKFDLNKDGLISREEFETAYKYHFNDGEESLNDIFDQFDPDGTGNVDYISWSMQLAPEKIPLITSRCRKVGPLARATPTEEEIELIQAMYQRGFELGTEAAKVGTRLLIDAEQVRYQPAIDKLVLDLQQTYNTQSLSKNKPIIYNTYQFYLKDAMERLEIDIQRAERFSFHFGAKFVRGAYMESERVWAAENGMPSPIHDTIEETHASYNDAVEYILKYSAEKADPRQQIELMVASHNQESIENAIEVMNAYDIDRKSSTICFAQLYGMTDNLSFNLGKHGYRAYKYVPYGEVSTVMPYLLRRARENSAIVGGAATELSMISEELRRRFRSPLQRILVD